MRWGVYLCTICVLGVFIASFWVRAEIDWRGIGAGQAPRGLYAVGLSRARMTIMSCPHPDYGYDCWGYLPRPNPISVTMPGKFNTSAGSVFARPKVFSFNVYGKMSFINIPLLYPTMVTLIASVVLFVRERRRVARLGAGCQPCGYPLADLSGDTCPECGAWHG